MRYSWEKRRHYWSDQASIAWDVVTGRILCLLGKHHVKFGTHPNCYRCGKRVR